MSEAGWSDGPGNGGARDMTCAPTDRGSFALSSSGRYGYWTVSFEAQVVGLAMQ
jgi:hypothetical protein